MESKDPLKELAMAINDASAETSSNQPKIEDKHKKVKKADKLSDKTAILWSVGGILVLVLLIFGVTRLAKGPKPTPATVKNEPAEVEQPKAPPTKAEPPKVEPKKVEPPKAPPVKVEPPKVEPKKVDPPKAPPVKVEPPKVEEMEPEGLSTDTETDVTKQYRGKISNGVLTLDKGKVTLGKYVRLMKAYENKKADKTVVMFFLTEPKQEIQFEGVSLSVWYQLTDQAGKSFRVDGNKNQTFAKRGIVSLELK